MIYISDGFIPQVEAFASKYSYNKFTINVLRTSMDVLSEKAEAPTGNHYMFICNEKLWRDVNVVLDTYLAQYHTDGTYLWSMKANDYIKVGAKGYNSYQWLGNEVTFTVDRTFTREFGSEKGYGVCIDLTADSTSKQPPVGLFTLKGGDMMSSYLKGVKHTTCAY